MSAMAFPSAFPHSGVLMQMEAGAVCWASPASAGTGPKPGRRLVLCSRGRAPSPRALVSSPKTRGKWGALNTCSRILGGAGDRGMGRAWAGPGPGQGPGPGMGGAICPASISKNRPRRSQDRRLEQKVRCVELAQLDVEQGDHVAATCVDQDVRPLLAHVDVSKIVEVFDRGNRAQVDLLPVGCRIEILDQVGPETSSKRKVSLPLPPVIVSSPAPHRGCLCRNHRSARHCRNRRATCRRRPGPAACRCRRR